MVRKFIRTASGGYEVDGASATFDPSGLLQFTFEPRPGINLDYTVWLVSEPVDLTGQYSTTWGTTSATITIVQTGSSLTGTLDIAADPPSLPFIGGVVGRTFGASDDCGGVRVTGTIDGPGGTQIWLVHGPC